MGFVKFVPSTTRGRKENTSFPEVTMRNNGMVHLNNLAYEALGGSENCPRVTFLHDPETGSFAIQPVKEKIAREYTLAVRQMIAGQNGWDISAQTFMKECGYLHENLRKWQAVWDAENGLLICSPENEIERPVKKAKEEQTATRANGRREANALVESKTA